MQMIFEGAAFWYAAIMAGWLGAAATAAHSISLSMAAATYLFVSGLGTAASIRVGNQLGYRSREGIRRAGFTALFMSACFMAVAAGLFIALRHVLPLYFSRDPGVLALAATLMIITAFFQLSDGLQVSGMGALRGLADVRRPTLIAFFAYWVVGLPLGYLLGNILKFGVAGIWIGLSIGLTVAAGLIIYRFHRLTLTMDLDKVAEEAVMGVGH
jgi:multidrug resistance protein, MATE family